MTSYDWPLIQKRGGGSIEDLVATLLRREYPNARQTNPSQGDGGVDVTRETGAGLEVWQVKGFTTPITSSQFTQIKRSWDKFWETRVSAGEAVAIYHLVTPWTPTEERIADFKKLTSNAEFECQWEGGAFIAGLADKFPETMKRFTEGEHFLESFVGAKSLLACSPIEQGDSISMLGAIGKRHEALDEIMQLVSDNYRIETGTFSVGPDDSFPVPPRVGPAAQYRMVRIDEHRWRYEAVVPRTEDSMTIEPLNLEVEFLEEPGTPEYESIREWSEWGVPFQDVNARIRTTGGPFKEAEPRELLLAVQPEPASLPPIYLRCVDEAGNTRFRWLVKEVRMTSGAETGWVLLTFSTPENTLDIEIRFKRGEDISASIRMGNVAGLNPESVISELELLAMIESEDELRFEIISGRSFLGAENVVLPSVLSTLFIPIARYLSSLQRYADIELVMPDVSTVRVDQVDHLAALVSIYAGNAWERTWEGNEITVPADPEEAQAIKRLIDSRDAATAMAFAELPVFRLGEEDYQLSHPIVSTYHSVELEPDLDFEQLNPGDKIRLFPGADNRITTASVVDWTPGSREL